MSEYIYTYQDWVEGKFECTFRTFYKNVSFDERIKIFDKQDDAYLKKITDSFICLKRDFIMVYNRSLTQVAYLNFYISMYRKLLDKYDESDEGRVISYESMYSLHSKDRRALTYEQAHEILSFDVSNWESSNYLTNTLRSSERELTEFNFILQSYFLDWLYWLQTQRKQSNSEPQINLLARASALEIERAPKELKRNHISYEWLKAPETALPELCKRLKAQSLIHPSTTTEQFQAVFTAQPLSEVQPIHWTGKNTLLAYFIDSIYSSGKIPIDTDFWRIAEQCFLNVSNLAQSRVNYLTNINEKHPNKPKNYSLIDEALKGL